MNAVDRAIAMLELAREGKSISLQNDEIDAALGALRPTTSSRSCMNFNGDKTKTCQICGHTHEKHVWDGI